jgi:tetratricopeptide (TPR) repeat protein
MDAVNADMHGVSRAGHPHMCVESLRFSSRRAEGLRCSKEKKMKRTISLWLAMLALVLMPAVAQEPTGMIHGQVINPTGAPQPGGTVSLSTDGGISMKYVFPVDASGGYHGQASPGNYMVIYRAADTPRGESVDSFKGVKIEAGQDTLQDIDMSRPAFIAKLSPEQRKQLEELKKSNAAALQSNKVIKALNADLQQVNVDVQDAENARAAAAQQLGAGASAADVQAKADEIAKGKYNDIVTMIQKDLQIRPQEPLLWMSMGRAQIGLKQYDDAITSFKKALDLATAAKKPLPEVLGDCNAGIGEAYARQGKVTEANAAFDAAAKDDPTRAAIHLRNEAVIFFQEHNTTAQVDAANKAISLDPNEAVLYYIKGQGLVQNATVDPKTQRIVLPQECTAAYKKYLDLAPNGPYAQEVAGILAAAGEKIPSSYKAPKH